MTNIEILKMVAEGHQVRENEDGYELTKAAFEDLKWKVEDNDEINLIQVEENENEYTLTDGTDSFQIKVEAQKHEIKKASWKIAYDKVGGIWYKMIGTSKNGFEVWTNNPDECIGKYGQKIKKKMLMRDPSEKKVKAFYNKKVKAIQKNEKSA